MLQGPEGRRLEGLYNQVHSTRSNCCHLPDIFHHINAQNCGTENAHPEKALCHSSTGAIETFRLRHVLIRLVLTKLFARSLLAVHETGHHPYRHEAWREMERILNNLLFHVNLNALVNYPPLMLKVLTALLASPDAKHSFESSCNTV